jgi:PIN like domain
VKVFFDHNMSPAMARALRELFKPEHEITTLAEKFRSDTPDIDWIEELNQEGRWVVFSGDRRITRNRAEYHAFRASNLIGLFLTSGLHKAPVIKQMERILALWPAILTVTDTVQGGAMYELPMKGTRLRQLKI